MFVTLPDGRYAIFAESYYDTPLSYGMFVSSSMEGPWEERSFVGPNLKNGSDRPGARHGVIVEVPEEHYQALLAAYGSKKQ